MKLGILSDTHNLLRPQAIAQRFGMDTALTEQIVRLYVTHPGVSVEGIMTKMGL